MGSSSIFVYTLLHTRICHTEGEIGTVPNTTHSRESTESNIQADIYIHFLFSKRQNIICDRLNFFTRPSCLLPSRAKILIQFFPRVSSIRGKMQIDDHYHHHHHTHRYEFSDIVIMNMSNVRINYFFFLFLSDIFDIILLNLL